jgi:hypothetical protein
MAFRIFEAAAALLLTIGQPVDIQNVPAASPLTYADLADLALAAPVVAHVRVREADALNSREARNLAPGHRRFLVQADVAALIRGDAVPPRISYLVDLPNDARGSAARIRKRSEFLILAQAAGASQGELRLAAPDAQLPFTATDGARLRELVRESMRPGSAPRITGIGRAFHVPGSLPGESETQFFLQTADNRPISLSVLRRPGQQPRWSVALGEMVDAAAETPRRDTLLWYRLACTLPGALPPQSVAEAAPAEANAIRADYRLIIQQLGPCVRNRVRR